MKILPFALHCTWLILVFPFAIGAGTKQSKKLNQDDIVKLLRNLDRDSSTLGNGGEDLVHTKPEKSEIVEDNTPGSRSSGSSSGDKPEARGSTTAIESGETYLTEKPIRIKIQGSHENKTSSVFYSIKPEDDDWLRKKVEQIKNSNF